MTSNHSDEAMLGALTALPTLASDPTRAERTRQRCRAQLRRQQQAGHRRASQVEIVRRGFGRVVVSALCVFYIVYVTALVTMTLRLQGLLP